MKSFENSMLQTLMGGHRHFDPPSPERRQRHHKSQISSLSVYAREFGQKKKNASEISPPPLNEEGGGTYIHVDIIIIHALHSTWKDGPKKLGRKKRLYNVDLFFSILVKKKPSPKILDFYGGGEGVDRAKTGSRGVA